MKNHLQFPAIILIVLCTITSCKKETGSTGPQGPSGPILSGSIYGFVDLFDQYGSRVLVNIDSSLVTIDNTTKQSYTDSTGKYTISNLQTGVYTITCSKSGYGTEKVIGQQFTGGGDLIRDIRLTAIPSYHLDSMTITTDSVNATIKGYMAPDNQLRTVLVFVGNRVNTSSNPANYLSFYNKNINANASFLTIVIPLNDLHNLGISSGTTVYFAAYGAAVNYSNSSSYEDLATGRTWFNGVSTTVVNSSITLP